MTKPVRAIDVMHAVPLDGRGKRTPKTLLAIDERNELIRAAAKFYPGLSARETARQLHSALSRFRDGRWQRDSVEATCPVQHKGRLTAVLWMILKVSDHVPSEPTIRRALGYS